MSNYLAKWNNFYLNMMTAANSPILTSKAHWRALAKEFRLEAWLERSYIRAEQRVAQLESERDAVLERERIELIEWAARSNEQFALRQQTQLELDTARAAIGRYQDERVALLGRIETLAAELQDQAQLIEQLKEQLLMVSG